MTTVLPPAADINDETPSAPLDDLHRDARDEIERAVTDAVDDLRLVKFSPNDLIIGRALNHPVYDLGNRLLLSAGNVITRRFKELLAERKIKEVLIHESDVQAATISQIVPLLTDDNTLGESLAERLDSLVDMTCLAVPNTGKSVKEQLVRQPAMGYNPEQLERINEQNHFAKESIDRMLQTALHGGPVDGTEISQLVSNYLDHMSRDLDLVIAMAKEVAQDAALIGHMLKMSILGMAVAIEMGLDEKNVRLVGTCGLIHDWGMVKIPKELREARRSLTAAELIQIKRHPIFVLEMLQKISGLPKVIPLVCYQVHERPDGSGYPRGRNQQQIHQFARILKVVDAYIALTSLRPMRPPLMAYAAMECLLRQSQQNSVDPQVVRALLNILSLFPVGSLVVLSDGSAARVIRSNGRAYTQPVVQLLQDRTGEAIVSGENEGIIDLTNSDRKIVQAIPTPGRNEVGMSDEILHSSNR
ncbi:MAG: HD domain-containing phosphohydrolase [Planctomycetaceae bacterium]